MIKLLLGGEKWWCCDMANGAAEVEPMGKGMYWVGRWALGAELQYSDIHCFPHHSIFRYLYSDRHSPCLPYFSRQSLKASNVPVCNAEEKGWKRATKMKEPMSSGSTYLRSNGPWAQTRDSPGLFNVSGPPRSRPPVQWRPLGSSLGGILLARWLAEGRSGTFCGFAVEPGKAEGCNPASAWRLY